MAYLKLVFKIKMAEGIYNFSMQVFSYSCYLYTSPWKNFMGDGQDYWIIGSEVRQIMPPQMVLCRLITFILPYNSIFSLERNTVEPHFTVTSATQSSELWSSSCSGDMGVVLGLTLIARVHAIWSHAHHLYNTKLVLGFYNLTKLVITLDMSTKCLGVHMWTDSTVCHMIVVMWHQVQKD